MEAVRSTYRSPRVKESPFKVTRSARKAKSRSPAVPTPRSKRVSARQTPKVRLRHDNSQVQFEPIVSSPSNPFNQESQILTERQKEMLERQRLTGGLFANMRALSPQKDAAPSSMEVHSDALSADELPPHKSRVTPMKSLATMGPMDAYLGSSPTPHARRSKQHIVSDDTSLATPTAVHTFKLEDNIDDLGSSPPRFAKEIGSKAREPPSDAPTEDAMGDSSEHRKPESSYSISFDEGTTIDEIALFDAVAAQELMDHDFPTDTMMSEPPSSAIELQVTAQLDADIQAHTDATRQATEVTSESNTEVMDLASDQLPSLVNAEQGGNETEVEDSQAHVIQKESEADISSPSRVGDSFSKPSPEKETPNNLSIRRSTRHSAVASPTPSPSGKKRKQGSAKQSKKTKKSRTEEIREKETISNQPTPAKEADQSAMLDNIVVELPSQGTITRSKKRKLRSDSTSQADSEVIIPDTGRKRSMPRSQSLLSQVENSQDVAVEDAPTPKRARQDTNQDVSEAKGTTIPSPTRKSRPSQVQVQVTDPSNPSHNDNGNDDQVQAETETETENQALSLSSPPPTSQSLSNRVMLSPKSIINQLKSLKDYLFQTPSLVLGADEERQIDDALFDIRRRVHAAGRRGEGEEEKKE